MKRKLRFAASSRIAVKLWILMTAICLAVLLCISLLLQFFLSSYVSRSYEHAAATNTGYTAAAFNELYDSILKRFVDIIGTSDFLSLMRLLDSDTEEASKQLSSELQDPLYDLSVSNTMVDNALFVTRTQVYSLANYRVRTGRQDFFLGMGTPELSGITLLPSQSSPIYNQRDALPLCIPLCIGNMQMTVVAEDASSASVILYLFLNSSRLSRYLSAYSEDSTEGILALAGQDGTIYLTTQEEAEEDPLFQSDSFRAHLSELLSTGRSSYTEFYDSNYLLASRVSSKNLYIINLLPISQGLEQVEETYHMLSYIAIASILLITLLAVALNRYLQRPLKQLLHSVQSIEQECYNSEERLIQRDELGHLSSAIDSMYQTIQEQMSTIKKEEREKFNAEIRLMSEQINPHFLYNTLECINMEVYSHHTENAAFMIQSLGDYLRIGLAGGAERIPISQEIEHVKAYLDIMNYRFGHSIVFSSSVEPELQSCSVLKCILQPLVENSIRHGFRMESSNFVVSVPSICVQAIRDDAYVYLRVIDNGIGIDIEKAYQSMRTSEDASSKRHVGLNNVYQRVRVFYSDAEITFTSIPYYQNTVEIRIPYEETL